MLDIGAYLYRQYICAVSSVIPVPPNRIVAIRIRGKITLSCTTREKIRNTSKAFWVDGLITASACRSRYGNISLLSVSLWLSPNIVHYGKMCCMYMCVGAATAGFSWNTVTIPIYLLCRWCTFYWLLFKPNYVVFCSIYIYSNVYSIAIILPTGSFPSI